MLNNHPAQETCRFAQTCFSSGATLLTFAFAVFALDILTLAFHGSISAWQVWIGLVLSSAFCIAQQRQAGSWNQALTVLVIILSLISSSLLVSSIFYDLSWDGQTYQQEAILQLSTGWNPFYQKIAESVKHSIWLNHYPKASWMLATSLYQTTNCLEIAKAFNWIFFACSFLLSVGALRYTTSLTKLKASAIAALLALNPIVMVQLFNFTLDGQVASLLLILGVLLYLVGTEVEHPNSLLLLATFSTTLLINLKFTSLVYAVAFILGLLSWLFYKKRNAFYQTAIRFTLCVFISIVGFGFNPYVSNVLSDGNLFYPLIGHNKIDIISAHIPVNFVQKSSVEKLIFSILAQSDAKLNAMARIKIPFSVQRKELLAVQSAKVGGFGVFFSGALLLSLVVLSLSWLEEFRLGLLSAFTILASTLINPEAWWARYAPQMWFLVILAILPGFTTQTLTKNRKVLRVCSYALVLVLSMNCLTIAAPEVYRAVQGTWIVNQQLQQLAQLSTKQVVVKYGLFRGNRSRFSEHGIAWTEVESKQLLPCQKPLIFYQSQTQFCPVSEL